MNKHQYAVLPTGFRVVHGGMVLGVHTAGVLPKGTLIPPPCVPTTFRRRCDATNAVKRAAAFYSTLGPLLDAWTHSRPRMGVLSTYQIVPVFAPADLLAWLQPKP